MQAVIMAGGFGTRLRPLTLNIPKPMVPIGGIPVMQHLVMLLRSHGFEDIVALLHFQAEQITEHFGDGSRFGVKMRYVMSQADLGTAGSVKNARAELKGQFLVISGDVATDIDLTSAVKFHAQRRAEASMVLSRVENPLQYGVVIIDDNGRITRFLEKPSWGQVFSDTVNTGIYILEPDVLDLAPLNTSFDFSKDLFPRMLADKRKLYGYVADGYWRDIGNADEYYKAHQDLLENRLHLGPFGTKLERDGATVWVGEETMISPRAVFAGTVIIGDKTKVGPRARLFNTVVGANSIIGREAELNRVITWDRVSIGPQAKLSEAVICKGVVVGEGAIIEENTIISDGARVGDDAIVKASVKVWPQKEVEAGAILSSSLIWGERWSKELFTDAKVTGIANVEVTPEFAARLGAAYGAMVGNNQTVIVSRDGSRASRMVTRALIAGLVSAGANVAELRTIPIPVLRYQLSLQIEAGGVYARVSPKGDNMMEIVFFDPGGYDIPDAKTKTIERLFLREDFRRASIDRTGRIEFPERVIEYYRDGFLQSLEVDVVRQARIRAVVDFSFGGASEILPAILGALDVDVVLVNAYPDPDQVISRQVESTKAARQLAMIVKSLRADAGFLIDPGAEKLIVFDERGNQIDNQMLLLKILSLYLEIKKCRKIAVPVVASSGVESIARQHGVEVTRVADNHLAMMDAMHSGGADFVGGTKGGFIFPGFQIGSDAMFTIAKIIEIMTLTGKRLGQVRGSWQRLKIVQKEVPCSWTKKGLVMRRLMETTTRKNRILVDGVRFTSNRSHITIKPDRYKASFSVQVESGSEEKAKTIVKEYASVIKQWQDAG